jgi:hypothetical protein
MRSPALNAEEVNRLLREEDGILFWRVKRGNMRVGTLAGSIVRRQMPNAKPYAIVRIHKRTYMVANVVWLLHVGRWPEGIIDHQDGNTMNNKIGNLRDVTQAENTKNMALSRRNTSGITGVAWHKGSGKWRAYIRGPGGIRHLGLFENIEAAAEARKTAQAALGYHPNHGRAT